MPTTIWELVLFGKVVKTFDESDLELRLLDHIIRFFGCNRRSIEDSDLPITLLDYAHKLIVELGFLVRNQSIELLVLGVEETDAVFLACDAVRESMEVVARHGFDVSRAF